MSCGVMTVRLVGDSTSEVSARVKSERVAMLMDGEWVSGIVETGSISGVVTRLTGED